MHNEIGLQTVFLKRSSPRFVAADMDDADAHLGVSAARYGPVDDPFDLKRFVDAQAGIYEHALAEIRSGSKRSHWMWFVFPQLTGLGHSVMARTFGITGLDEARAFLDHPVLGAHLREITSALAAISPPDAEEVFGQTDAVKLCSSLTLFARAAPHGETLFDRTLARWFGGLEDPATASRL